jgi:single-strand DNA-binding protein
MYQQITLIGHLGDNPEMRYTPSGIPVTNFRLAVNKRSTSADGQLQEKTTWFQITLWRKQAELANQYLKKGGRVMVIGEVSDARPWTDRDGNARASIDVTAYEIRFLDSRSREQDGGTNETTGVGQPTAAEPADIPF